MKVIAINGSPHKEGNTYQALKIVGDVLAKRGVEFEIFHVGDKAIHGCTACGVCRSKKDGKCSITTDCVNEGITKMREADGIILGSPVYCAGIAGTMKCFLDRVFYVAGSSGSIFRHKVGAAVVALRRSGGTSTLDGLNHYITYSEMAFATANYWNIIHGRVAPEVLQDEEGVQTLEILANNILWQLEMREATKNSISTPLLQEKKFTGFIR